MAVFSHKLLTPQHHNHLVSRPRLTELIGIISNQKLVILSAPAGYGKTSLLIDFAHTAASLPVCWYALDSFDADPWTFLGYLAAAMSHRFPASMEQTSTLLSGGTHSSLTSVVVTFLNEVIAIASDFVLIIDDWHLVDHVTEIRSLVARLVHHCPNCRVILSSRSYPSLPDLMLLFVRRQMSGLGEQQLRFTPPEVLAVLNAGGEAPISLEQAELLTEQTNGWITGILLSVQVTEQLAPLPLSPGATVEHQVYHFLAEQVLEKQPPAIQTFLLESALLGELTPDWCDIVLGRHDSGLMLEHVRRHHLFVSEIDASVLRYHQLFRDFLREHFRTTDPQGYQAVVAQLAAAYMDREQWTHAFDACIGAGNLPAAQRIVVSVGEHLYTRGRLETLDHFFAALPQHHLDAPLLCLKARLLLTRGQYHEATALVALAAGCAQPADTPIVLLLQAQLARMAGHYAHAIDLGLQVLATTQDASHRAYALRTLAIAHHRSGETTRAIEELQEALAYEQQRGDLYTTGLIWHDLGVCHEEIGLLREAEDFYSHAEACWVTMNNTGFRAMSLNSKGVVQHLAGHYQEAHATFTLALECARTAAMPRHEATVLVSLGDLYSDLQAWAQANSMYDAARRIGISAHLVHYLDLAAIRLLVRQRRFSDALHALNRLPESAMNFRPISLLLLRASIVYGLGDYDQAASMVRQAITDCEQQGSRVDLARAYLTQAQIANKANPSDAAALITPLEQAVQLANQIGYDAFLIAETLHMPGLLRRAHVAGWVRAAQWLRSQQGILEVAQKLGLDDTRPRLVVRALGTDELLLDDQPVDISWSNAREVFYYLLAHPDGASLDDLCEAIWAERTVEESREAVHVAIYRLRSALPRDLITLHRRKVYRLNLDVVRLDYDVERFQHTIDMASDNIEAYFSAFDLYLGPYLHRSGSLWCIPLRTHLEQRYLHALRLAATQCEQARVHLDALPLYQRILALNPLDEAAHAGVMRCQVALCNRAGAIEQYHVLRHAIQEELGLDLERTSEAEQIYMALLNAS